MKPSEFPYKTSFSAEIKCLVSSETDKFLSLASLENLKFLIPQNFIDAQGIDLLPIAYDACVVNRCNKNGDSIDTATAMSICRNFIHRPVDIEHKPLEICGHIINAGYTQFGTDKQLMEDEIKDLKDPFNLALASYIYARNYMDLAEMLEESADPDSLKYQSISASWELLFNKYKIVKGPKNLAEATIIEDPNEAKDLEEFLQVNKGSGKDKQGNFIYRLITGEVYAGGIGLTKNPAAQVKGIFVPGITNKPDDKDAKSKASENNLKNNIKIISNSDKLDVNKIDMKLSTLADVKALTDSKLKEALASDNTSIASDLNNVLEKELARISSEVMAERKEKEDAVSNASKVAEDLKKVKADLEDMKSQSLAKEKETAFNNRMASLDETYKLEDAHRKIIANQIKDLDEAGFISWAKDFEVMAGADKKKAKAKADDDESEAAKKAKDAKDAEEAKAAKDKKDKEDKDKADKDGKKDAMASTARTLLEQIKVNTAEVIPNTASTTESLVEKYKNAFGKENIIVKQRK